MVKKVQIRAFPDICTPAQLAEQINRTASFVQGMKKTMLDVCYPFPFVDPFGEEKLGPVFIIKNERYTDFITKWYRPKPTTNGHHRNS